MNQFGNRKQVSISPEQREYIKRYIESGDGAQSVVRSMFAVLEHEQTAEEDRQRAFSTIAEALLLSPENGPGSNGIDLTKVERGPAKGHPAEPSKRIDANRLDHLVTHQASFADRLSQLLIEKNITQEELADRIGCTQSGISKMLTRNARPRRTTILKMAETLNVEPKELWPQLEVAAILDSVGDFFADRELTHEQAKALEAASQRPPVKVKPRELPSRKRN